ncbi:unnamed protein product [Lepeophtheirus salmonis]|uniref:ATP-dependent DNA helicase n=1 Tax=Lepeophtheirus salmonis TaxID=72036 RepID=A0A7R8H3X4_LEPSM|nr:unnamed protein product [Lepeophtheirus salmonis]CAF2852128.1 unnamed protein product [Lepeophtheirus salmonis]
MVRLWNTHPLFFIKRRKRGERDSVVISFSTTQGGSSPSVSAAQPPQHISQVCPNSCAIPTHNHSSIEITMADILLAFQENCFTVDLDFEKCPSGGIMVLFSGVWRQILLMIPKGNDGDILRICLLNSSILWPYVHVLTLTQNIRASKADYGSSKQMNQMERIHSFMGYSEEGRVKRGGKNGTLRTQLVQCSESRMFFNPRKEVCRWFFRRNDGYE